MLFQDILLQRIIILFVVQTWPILYFLILANKLLKRKKSILTLTFSTYMILNALGYSLSFVSVIFIFVNEQLAYLTYLFCLYFTVFSQSFIVIFSWLLLNLDKKISYKTYYLLIILYVSLTSYIFFGAYLFKGIKYDLYSGWRPEYAIEFLVASWVYLTLFLIVPQIILTPKLLNAFEGANLKKRIRKFLISIFLEYVTIYFLVLYNTWTENSIFRLIFPAINFVIGMIAAYYIYKGLVMELE